MIDFKKAVKKCPFCGCSAYLRKCFGFLGRVGYAVECAGCKARTPIRLPGDGYVKPNEHGDKVTFFTRDDNDIVNSLINEWNKRIS